MTEDIQRKSRKGAEYVIFSFENALKAINDAHGWEVARDYLAKAYEVIQHENGRQAKALYGLWKGEQENSYLLSVEAYAKCIKHIAFKGLVQREECVLVIGPEWDARGRSRARLYKPLGDPLPDGDLGFIGDAPENFARLQDGFTYDPSQNKYFICLSGDDWRHYEILKSEVGDVASLGKDWRQYRRGVAKAGALVG